MLIIYVGMCIELNAHEGVLILPHTLLAHVWYKSVLTQWEALGNSCAYTMFSLNTYATMPLKELWECFNNAIHSHFEPPNNFTLA